MPWFLGRCGGAYLRDNLRLVISHSLPRRHSRQLLGLRERKPYRLRSLFSCLAARFRAPSASIWTSVTRKRPRRMVRRGRLCLTEFSPD